MLVIFWLLLGGLLGFWANFFMPGKVKPIPVLSILVGLVGSIIGGVLALYGGLGGIHDFNLGLVLAPLFGAYFVLASFRFATC